LHPKALTRSHNKPLLCIPLLWGHNISSRNCAGF
jgi:hypothetical protein